MRFRPVSSNRHFETLLARLLLTMRPAFKSLGARLQNHRNV
ncbi:hypothetical protein AVEN_214941-1, partial [Araneus ventricosus]